MITRFSRTKYNLSKFTSSRFCWYLNHNNSGFLASRILKAVVKVAVLFCSQLNYATRRSIPFCSDQMGVSAWHQIFHLLFPPLTDLEDVATAGLRGEFAW